MDSELLLKLIDYLSALSRTLLRFLWTTFVETAVFSSYVFADVAVPKIAELLWRKKEFGFRTMYKVYITLNWKILNVLLKYIESQTFPASGGLFSVVFAELTGTRKRFCPGSKRTVLNMRHGYLATEPSREAMLLCGLTK